MSHTSRRFTKIFTSIKNDPYKSLLIILIGALQLFYKSIPLASVIITMLSLGIISYFQYAVIAGTVVGDAGGVVISPRRLLVKRLLIPISTAVVWALFTFNKFVYINNIIASFVAIYAVITVTSYFIRRDDTCLELKQRLINMFIAIIFGIIIYLGIYLGAHLLAVITRYEVDYSGMIFRVSSAIASMVVLMILTSYEYNPDYKNSGFYNIMFGIVVPILAVVLGIGYTIYSSQIHILGIGNNNFTGYIYLAQTIYAIGLISYALTSTLESKIPARVVGIFAIVLPIVLIINAYDVMSFSLDPRLFFGIIEVNKLGFYYIAFVYGLLAAFYALIYIFRGAETNYGIKYILVVISIVMFLPVVGYVDSHNIAAGSKEFNQILATKNDTSYWDLFQKNPRDRNVYDLRRLLYRESDRLVNGNIINGVYLTDKEKKQYNELPASLTYYYSAAKRQNINVTGYKNMYRGISVSRDLDSDYGKVSVGNHDMYIDKDMKTLVVVNNDTKRTESIDLYSFIKEKVNDEPVKGDTEANKKAAATNGENNRSLEIKINGLTFIIDEYEFTKYVVNNPKLGDKKIQATAVIRGFVFI